MSVSRFEIEPGYTELQRRADGSLVFIEDWIGWRPSWWQPRWDDKRVESRMSYADDWRAVKQYQDWMRFFKDAKPFTELSHAEQYAWTALTRTEPGSVLYVFFVSRLELEGARPPGSAAKAVGEFHEMSVDQRKPWNELFANIASTYKRLDEEAPG